MGPIILLIGINSNKIKRFIVTKDGIILEKGRKQILKRSWNEINRIETYFSRDTNMYLAKFQYTTIEICYGDNDSISFDERDDFKKPLLIKAYSYLYKYGTKYKIPILDKLGWTKLIKK
jgi:hypothetical protein